MSFFFRFFILDITWAAETWIRFAGWSDMHRDSRPMRRYINAIMDVSLHIFRSCMERINAEISRRIPMGHA